MTRGKPTDHRRFSSARVLLAAIAILAAAAASGGQEQVRVSVPAIVDFEALDVTTSTVASTNPSSLSFSDAVLQPGQSIRISVKADSDLVPPSGRALPAESVSWTTSHAVRGVASNGVLSKTAYTEVFQGQADATSGSADLNWVLSAPGVPLRAGAHQVSLRWKIEAIVP